MHHIIIAVSSAYSGVCGTSKKIGLLSVRNAEQNSEAGRSDSETAQVFSAVVTDFSSLMLKIKLSLRL